MLRIGPSGNSLAFYASGHKNTVEAAAWLRSIGLNAYEYSFGRGVNISDSTAAKIAEQMRSNDIAISVHAPYYTNFSNPDGEMISKSIGYIKQSIIACHKLGGNRVVFHPAACGKMCRNDAVALAYDNISKMMDQLLADNDLKDIDYILCPETMGKLAQIGTVEEIVSFCGIDRHLVPCFDFGHINSYSQGSLRGYDDYKRIIDYTYDKLGDRAFIVHIHFSKIMYGERGEIKHLTFTDKTYGPEYEPLARVIDDMNMSPVVICESHETMSDDAIIMKNCHKIFY